MKYFHISGLLRAKISGDTLKLIELLQKEMATNCGHIPSTHPIHEIVYFIYFSVADIAPSPDTPVDTQKKLLHKVKKARNEIKGLIKYTI